MASRLEGSVVAFLWVDIEEEGLPRGKTRESSDVKRETKIGREGKRRSTDGKENFIFGGWFK